MAQIGSDYGRAMRIGVLGPLHIECGGETIDVSAAKERSLLRVLALSAGSVVSTERIIDALWGEAPPRAARKTLQTYVWSIRKLLGEEVVETRPTGYRLALDGVEIDVVDFRRLVDSGENALRRGDVNGARASLGAATALWRGDPVGDVAAHTGLSHLGVRLHEEYLSALEARIAGDLAVGQHAELIGELEELVLAHPFRERLWGHLMVALYRAGRQADALDAYDRVRRLLVEELGLQPGGELRRLELAVLEQDPALDAAVLAPTASDDSVSPSPIRYATCDDGVTIAYQTAGAGPVDVLVIPGFVHHLDIWWNAPTDRLIRTLASLGRVIMFDRRGTGLSDRPDQVSGDGWLADALAVLDEVDAQHVVVLGISCGAQTALQLAHAHTDRVRGLALFGGYARSLRAPDYDIGTDPDDSAAFVDRLIEGWGTGSELETFAPTCATDPAMRDYWARYQLLSASPPAARRLLDAMIQSDVRSLVPEIDVPTVVMHPTRDRAVTVDRGRWIADHLPDARFVPVDSDIHLLCLSDVIDVVAAEITDLAHRVMPDNHTADQNRFDPDSVAT